MNLGNNQLPGSLEAKSQLQPDLLQDLLENTRIILSNNLELVETEKPPLSLNHYLVSDASVDINLSENKPNIQSISNNPISIENDFIVKNELVLDAAVNRNNSNILVVNTTADLVNINDGLTSLREAILQANKSPNTHYEIILESGESYDINIRGRNEDYGLTGDFDVKGNISIITDGEAKTTINGGNIDRLFHVQQGANFQVKNLVLTGGNANGGFGGAILTEKGNTTVIDSILFKNIAKNGGGLYVTAENANPATLTLKNSVISHNNTIRSTIGGAGIMGVQSTVNIEDSLIDNNVVDKAFDVTRAWGGGAYFTQWSKVNITNTRVTNNSSYNGAGIATSWNTEVKVDASFFGTNIAQESGGGAYFGVKNIIINTDFEKNEARVGGGFYATGNTNFTGKSKVIGNRAASGGGAAIGGDSFLEGILFEDNHVEGILNLGEGGAITYGAGGKHQLLNGEVINNSAVTGGGVAVGKLATRDNDTYVTIDNVLFERNKSTVGGHLANIYGDVDISNSIFRKGEATNGGAIYVDERGHTSISHSSFLENQASKFGGAISNVDGKFTVNFSEFSHNIGSEGGAIHNNGEATISDSLFTRNQVVDDLVGNKIFEGKGSALFAAPTSETKISNSTLTDNRATGGGVIFIDGSVTGLGYSAATVWMRNNTVVNNQRDSDDDGYGVSAGVYIFPGNDNQDRYPGVLYAYNNIIAQNDSNTDIFGSVTEARNNLIGNGADATGINNNVNGNIVGTETNPLDPLIAPLADNGGITRTHLLLSGSSAIDRGDNNYVLSDNDQRGVEFDRIVNGTVDIGALEVQETQANLNLQGTPGNDTLTGGSGQDTLAGLAGNDVLTGNEGNDTISGGNGNDRLFGGENDDLLLGDAGRDALNGGSGNDSLSGGENRDILNGGAGNDVLFGDGDHDILEGNDGSDIFVGGAGNDLFVGGAGRDFFILEVNQGRDNIRDFADNIDKLVLTNGLTVADLSINNNSFGTATIIGDNTGSTLAILKDVDAGIITENDFVVLN